MKSMTGFAQGRFEFDHFSFNISFKSLNHRFLDIGFRGTGITPASEKLIKDIVKDKVSRGKIEIVFNLFERDPFKWNIQFNEYLLEEILDKIIRFNKKYKDKFTLSLDSLLKIPMVFHLDYIFDRFSEQGIENIKNSIRKVFDEFQESRCQEGQYILKDLSASMNSIRDHLKVIEKKAEKIEQEMFSSYKQKIGKFLEEIEIDQRRIAQEAAIAAEKACITEEINRLGIHNQRLKSLLENRELEVKGREADFLAQEMQRETHTIASKTTSMDVHRQVLLIRREIEKIKQQVQNVE